MRFVLINMNTLRIQKLILVFFTLTAIEAIAALVFLLQIPADPKNSVLFGYSMQRLLLITSLILAAGFSAYLMFNIYRKPDLVEWIVGRVLHSDAVFLWTILTMTVISVVGLVILSRDPYSFGRYKYYLIRLRPIILYGVLVCVQALIVVLSASWGKCIKFLNYFVMFLGKNKAFFVYALLWTWILGVVFIYWLRADDPGLSVFVEWVGRTKAKLKDFFREGYKG